MRWCFIAPVAASAGAEMEGRSLTYAGQLGLYRLLLPPPPHIGPRLTVWVPHTGYPLSTPRITTGPKQQHWHDPCSPGASTYHSQWISKLGQLQLQIKTCSGPPAITDETHHSSQYHPEWNMPRCSHNPLTVKHARIKHCFRRETRTHTARTPPTHTSVVWLQIRYLSWWLIRSSVNPPAAACCTYCRT